MRVPGNGWHAAGRPLTLNRGGDVLRLVAARDFAGARLPPGPCFSLGVVALADTAGALAEGLAGRYALLGLAIAKDFVLVQRDKCQ